VGLRIAIVEDQRDCAETLRLMLEAMGHQVAAAYTGPEGLELVKQYRPDVVICDIGLPGLNGWEVARGVRRDPTVADARLIALTGYGTAEDRKRSREAGFDVHLVKPVPPEVLEDLLAS
jgi:CheY-like chemotaxis protein